jgi:hypothetical protein
MPHKLSVNNGVRFAVIICILAVTSGLAAQQTREITPDALQKWLSYISSDELEGRNTFSEGLGLAAAYIADQIKEKGVKPGGDHGTYFQRVTVLGVNSTNKSKLTVEVNGETRTFSDGDGISFPKNVGGQRTFTINEVVFVGYGLSLSTAHDDYRDLDVKDKAVVWVDPQAAVLPDEASRFLDSRESIAVDEHGAAATIAPMSSRSQRRRSGRRGNGVASDFTSVQRLDSPLAPSLGANEDFLDFIFSASPVKYSDIKAQASSKTDLPTFSLKGVKLTFTLDADYEVVSTQYTRNVVGVVEGADPELKNTYVAFGAHYDHLGYNQSILDPGETDRISNGADDDGSGTTALIAIARAAAVGPKGKRSRLFVWHAGEERGLYGSKYFADHPEVPLDHIVAQLNIDMIGRNRDNKAAEENTVYAVGSDRISTELHRILIDVNGSERTPLTLNFEMNDRADPERIYFRSDHFSYAAKGIPVVFFFTGLHPDYHRVTDSVEKIHFAKMARITQLVSDLGQRLANLDHAPVRDFKGPRAGR